MDIILKYKAWVGKYHPDIAGKLTNSDIETFAIEFAERLLEEAAEINEEDIDKLATKYAEDENSCYSNDYYGYAYGYRKAKESILNKPKE